MRAPRSCMFVALLVGSVPACAGKPEQAGTPAPSAGDELAAAGNGLEGNWVEFWSVTGRAETQRYTFLADGRFGWTAAQDAAASPARRFGRYRTAGAELVLQVQGEDARADCTEAAPCRTLREPPAELRLALGECPDNAEASALDQGYRCQSIGGQAFWRSTSLAADHLAEQAR